MKKTVWILIILTPLLTTCNSSKYVNDVPYKFSYDESSIKKELGIDGQSSVTAIEYDKNLTDREIYLKEKYAIILNVSPGEVNDYEFYGFVDDWLNTPHTTEKKMDKQGANMVSFTQALYNQVYKVKLPAASAAEIFTAPQLEKFTGRGFLEEGDLIFFRYSKDLPVSDVAIYLKNDKILMSTQNAGLAIFDFNSDYFQTRYLASGRVLKQEKKSEEL